MNQWINESVKRSELVSRWSNKSMNQWLSRRADYGDGSALLRALQFFTFFMWNRALATVSCTFCRPDLSKVLPAPQFLTFSSANRALTSPTHFCRQLSQIEPRTRRNRDPTSVTPGATLSEKTQRFAPESVFTRKFTRFRVVTLYNCLTMGSWHIMMRWLTWWCECWPWQWSGTRPFSN